MNQRIRANIKIDAKKFCHLDEVYLIETEEKPIEYNGRYPFGEPASLPAVICIAELRCYDVFRNKEKCYSALGLIWFQEEFMFPIDAAVLEQIKAVPFSKICGEFCD